MSLASEKLLLDILLDIQVEISGRQLEFLVWNLGERSGREMSSLRVIRLKTILKTYNLP